MSAFAVLFLAHLLGDFPCQPFNLIRWKIASARGLAVHVAIQTLLAAPVMIWLVPRWGFWLAVLAVTHYLIDWVKVRYTRAGWVELGAFFLDQAAHITVLAAIARSSGASAAAVGGTAALALRLAIILVLAVYAGAVVEFLVGAALRGRRDDFAPIPSAERWRGSLERLAMVLAVLALPAPLWIVLAAGYVLATPWLARERPAWLTQAVSTGWALAVTLLAPRVVV